MGEGVHHGVVCDASKCLDNCSEAQGQSQITSLHKQAKRKRHTIHKLKARQGKYIFQQDNYSSHIKSSQKVHGY